MIVVMVSKWIGDRFNSPLYDSHVALKDMPYLEAKLPSWVPTYVTAHDIMNPRVMTLPAICSLRVLLHVINDPTHEHSAFAVLEGPGVNPKELSKSNNKYTQRSGTFAGMVLRWHILILLNNKHYGTPEKLLKFTQKNILTQAQMTDRTWKHVTFFLLFVLIADINKMHVTLEELNVRDDELDTLFIDLSPYIYLSPITVSPHTPINIVYSIFRGLGMRHLICLDENEKIAGVITCHELIDSNLEEVVNRVHKLFDSSSDPNEMFEQRLRFLKNYDTFLLSSGNKWLSFIHLKSQRKSINDRHAGLLFSLSDAEDTE
ncbi:chloride channel protein [Reticulomyxa filosa]|uniref:Chloride channel protein n=1 Tax=Reticulomyxa filosa TaxID=46433 RepID=X6MV61_RETFI|nr:chloride channel protein [Reticulomyxa filosa]|eukprot:ETO17739.1 chloride channel protein [Reticulomyxa filosa]